MSVQLYSQSIRNPKQTSLFNRMIHILKENKPNIPLYVKDVNDWVTYETLLLYNMKMCSGAIFEIENNIQAIVNKRIASKVKSLYKKYFGPIKQK